MPASTPPPSDPFITRFTEYLGTRETASFAEFMQLALYDPVCGYYRQKRERVARQQKADFYTSESFREVFSSLIAASAVHLLDGRDPGDFSFVEVGAEPGGGLLAEALSAFRDVRIVGLGDRLELPTHAVLFSNELYDAQPFHRVVRKEGHWVESGVTLSDGFPAWKELERVSPPVRQLLDRLPADAAETTVIDLPIASAELLQIQLAGDWDGILIAADYGKSWTVLAEDFSEGTGRAYRNHRQESDLLAAPGSQDLTCHICWDWMEDILRQNRFTGIKLESQEAFFMHHAPDVIQQIIAGPGGPLSPAHSQLKTLLHPGLMGQKFQVLHGRRIKNQG